MARSTLERSALKDAHSQVDLHDHGAYKYGLEYSIG